MELVIEKEILNKYFDLRINKPRNENDNLLLNAINSLKNKFKFSSNYIDKLEEYFSQISNEKRQLFNAFIQSCYEDKQLVPIKSSDIFVSDDDELLQTFYYQINDFTFLLSKCDNSFLKAKLPYNISIFNNIEKPNIDWIILGLSTRITIDIDYSFLNSNKKIEELFKSITSFSFSVNEIRILDSYFNLNRSSIYNYINHQNQKVKCYTRLFDRKPSDKKIKADNIKNHFGKNKTSVAFSTNTKIVHERKIAIKNLIIDATHDFAEILPENNNWTIYLVVCDEKNKLVNDKLIKYN